MSYVIRPFRDADALALAQLTLAAIRNIGPRAYSSEQIEAWAARHPGPERLLDRVRTGALIVVATDDHDCPAAYALLEMVPDEGAHLDMLYCHPDHTRRGLAERLLEDAEALARRKAVSRIYTEASELARPVFDRAGYVLRHRRDFTIEHEGRFVPIHNYAMEKWLG